MIFQYFSKVRIIFLVKKDVYSFKYIQILVCTYILNYTEGRSWWVRGHYALDPTENRTSLAWDFKPISACPLKCENSKYPSKLWAQLGTHSENTVCV